MQNFAKIALLGAALVAAAPIASATALTGEIGFTDSPATYTMSGGVFNLLSVYYGPEAPMPNQPALSSLSPLLSYFSNNPVLQIFSTASVPGTAIWEGTETLTTPVDTETFSASSFTAPEDNNGLITFTIYGVFADSKGYLANTNGYIDVTLNPLSGDPTVGATGVLTENVFAQTPEPSSLTLLGTGLMSAGSLLTRRRKVSA